MARRILALDHQAKLISPQFVRPFVQGNKNDFADAQAICEAASRPSMRLVSARNEAQQTVSALRRVRESLVRERTGVINQVHALLLEFGISPPRGQAIIRRLPAVLAEQELPPRLGIWGRELLARCHSNVVACALANKLARIAWAILANGTNYRSGQAVSAT